MLIDVAIVVVDPENPLGVQEDYKTWLESKDYVNSATYEAYDVSQATLNTYDLVVALSSGSVCKGLSVPVLGSWPTNYNALKIGTAGGSASGITAINITDNTHYITEVFGTGNLTVYSESGSIRHTKGNSLDVIDLAEQVGSSDNKQLLYLEKGDLHIDETVCTERIVFCGVPGDVDILTEDAETLLERVFGWLMYEDEEGEVHSIEGAVSSNASLTGSLSIKRFLGGTISAISSFVGKLFEEEVIAKQVVEFYTPITMEVEMKTPIAKEVEFDTPVVKEVTFRTPIKGK